jgi:hypothetical protein
MTRNQLARLILALAFALLFICTLLIILNIATPYILSTLIAYGATIFFLGLMETRGWDQSN